MVTNLSMGTARLTAVDITQARRIRRFNTVYYESILGPPRFRAENYCLSPWHVLKLLYNRCINAMHRVGHVGDQGPRRAVALRPETV